MFLFCVCALRKILSTIMQCYIYNAKSITQADGGLWVLKHDGTSGGHGVFIVDSVAPA